MLFEIDTVRGLAYRGKKGFVIQVNPKGVLYVNFSKRKMLLTPRNSKILENVHEVG